MNSWKRETRTSFCVLARSVAWKSSLEKRLPECSGQARIAWALDIDDLLSEVALSGVTFVIVELHKNSVAEDCRKISLATTDLPQARFFALADADLKNWLPLIRVCGFTDCYGSVERLDRLASMIRRHIQSQPVDEKSVEERVCESLPWKPCSLP